VKLSDFVIDWLVRFGVKHVFLLPGGGAMHLNDSVAKNKTLRVVCNLHEQASAIAAEAYAQYTGLGVVMVTTGPGGTNTITGVAGAWLESTPVLFISGQVKRSDLRGVRQVRQVGFQEVDIVSLVKSITKYAVTVTSPSDIRACLEEAVWRATTGRKGPVWIDLPLDVQAAEVDETQLAPFRIPAVRDNSEEVRQGAARLIRLLEGARRPVFLLGHGIRNAGAVEKFMTWIEEVKAPVLTTWKALDFLPDEHPLYIGRPGAVGQRAANFAQQTADLFVSIGARLDFGQTAYNHQNFAPRARRIVVDIDGSEIAKLEMPLELGLVCNALDFVNALCQATPLGFSAERPRWMTRIKEWKRRYPVLRPEYENVQKGVNNYVFVHALGQSLHEADLLVPGSSGACSEITCQALPVRKGIRFINTQGLGSMGFGIPGALGACIASEQKRTICIDGDGGFAMNVQELALVSKLRLPIKFFVLNNGGYGSIKATQRNYFDSRFLATDETSGLYLPSIQGMAQGFDLPYRLIDSHFELPRQIAEVLDFEGPVVVEVMMSADQVTQPKVSSHRNPDGTMSTLPMEDMWPFLDRDELSRELLVED